MLAWEPSFDVYMARLEGDVPICVVLDMGLSKLAPLATHPVRLLVRIKLRWPRPDGLRDDREQEALAALEDELVELLSTREHAVFVGRFGAEGMLTFGFYLPGPPRPIALPALGDYHAETAVEEDAEWDFYRNFLFPHPAALQCMLNRHVIKNLVDAGDDLGQPRLIDFLALFPDAARADSAAAALRERGFDTDAPRTATTPPPRADLPIALAFHRVDTLADGRADELCIDIVDTLEAFDGQLDGWGAPPATPARLPS